MQAGRRLEMQRSWFEDGGVAAADERRLVVGDAARLHNASSQIGGKRPIQGCEVSPDGTTLATADWDGIVSFWTLEDKLVRLQVTQVLVQSHQQSTFITATKRNVYASAKHMISPMFDTGAGA